MRGVCWVSCGWPGASRLWFQGDVTALIIAMTFAVLVNALLVVTWVRPDLVSTAWRVVGWGLVVGCWIVGCWGNVRTQRGLRDRPELRDDENRQNQQDLFIQAQAEYLRGHWGESQALLEQLIDRAPSDVEAQLLLASVFRRSRRIDQSRRQLLGIERLEDAKRWHREVQHELKMLDRLADMAD